MSLMFILFLETMYNRTTQTGFSTNNAEFQCFFWMDCLFKLANLSNTHLKKLCPIN